MNFEGAHKAKPARMVLSMERVAKKPQNHKPKNMVWLLQIGERDQATAR